MKLANSNGRVNARRITVLNALKEQLKSGVKTAKGTHVLTAATTGNNIPLEEQDIKRIKKEISILESRIVAPEVALSTRTKKHRNGVRR